MKQGFAVNFNDIINSYRVKKVKQQLQNAANLNLTIISLAYNTGFNSKTSFNRTLKKATGKSPKAFLGH
ncbi:MAG: helix-turn-helix domain-containing protein [Flavobacterium sp.]|nr:helix-turn-helix domain-containing protein [Flavobacterium sp.]